MTKTTRNPKTGVNPTETERNEREKRRKMTPYFAGKEVLVRTLGRISTIFITIIFLF
jgi:hypothetical protein